MSKSKLLILDALLSTAVMPASRAQVIDMSKFMVPPLQLRKMSLNRHIASISFVI
jgi:hypothetical protein